MKRPRRLPAALTLAAALIAASFTALATPANATSEHCTVHHVYKHDTEPVWFFQTRVGINWQYRHCGDGVQGPLAEDFYYRQDRLTVYRNDGTPLLDTRMVIHWKVRNGLTGGTYERWSTSSSHAEKFYVALNPRKEHYPRALAWVWIDPKPGDVWDTRWLDCYLPRKSACINT